MAGGRLVDDVLTRIRDGRSRRPVHVTVVGAEPYGAYNRVLLSDVVAGRADVATLSLHDPRTLADAGVDVRVGDAVRSIDLPAHGQGDVSADVLADAFTDAPADGAGAPSPGTVTLASGAVITFDRLVLATGAEPVVPALSGLDVTTGELPAGVHTLRTVDDAREIVAATVNARTAVVLGGGPLGLEAARGLARRGLDVTVLHSGGHLLEGLLDAAGAAVLDRSLRRLGVATRCAVRATGIETVTGPDGVRRLAGVRLADGPVAPAQVLVIACGVRPRTGLARGAGLVVRRGVVVDDALTTSDPRVLAIGDCAEHRGQVSGLVAPAWGQAAAVADLLTGADPDARWSGHRPTVRLKAADVEVAAVGACAADPWTDEAGVDVVQLLDPGAGRYVKAVVRDGVVVGAIAVGDARAAADLTLLVERGSTAPLDRTSLVTGAARRAGVTADDPTRIPDRATVCRCNGVTKGAIVRAWSAGARTRDAVTRTTRATTGCGSCAEIVGGLLAWLDASDPDDERTQAPSHDLGRRAVTATGGKP
ncbi:MAG: NAD(P)/FAD-dependent oxidoreductase [Actinobacteria bacterium]|nr:NAD(P)/FAD-dependent oxidoreductase [Actinomycetota bacterium]